MVLHNNKWDKKAKKAYLRKHGLQTPVAAPVQGPKWTRHDEDSDSDDDVQSVENSEGSGHEASEQSSSAAEASTASAGDVVDPESGPVTNFDDILDSRDPEEELLIKQQIARVQQQEAARDKTQKAHIIYTKDFGEFDQIEKNVEYSAMTRDIRRRFGKAKANTAHLDEDDEFDDFMESVKVEKDAVDHDSSQTQVKIDADKQAYIDSLLG